MALTVTRGATVLGVSRQILNNLVNGMCGMSPGMRLRLSKAYGGEPETWLRIQLVYDLAQARRVEAKCIVTFSQLYKTEEIYGSHFQCESFPRTQQHTLAMRSGDKALPLSLQMLVRHDLTPASSAGATL